MTMTYRRLGQSDVRVSPVALGCWPLAGITSGTMTDAAVLAVIDAALESGINHLDTAHAYGRDGESERRVGRAIRSRRAEVVLATKVASTGTKTAAYNVLGVPCCFAGTSRRVFGGWK